MRLLLSRLSASSLLSLGAVYSASAMQATRPDTAIVVEPAQGTYFWSSAPIHKSAELLTLQCRGCYGAESAPIPLVSVLRDTLGDTDPTNDRVSYVWLLCAPHVGLGRRALSAVPFFYWPIGGSNTRLSAHDMLPELNLTAPSNSTLSGISWQLIQWTALDPFTTWARASSRSYASNFSDNSRFHLEQTESYLRHAPISDAPDSLTRQELNTVIARLELRKTLIGGLFDDRHAARFADESAFDEERIRSRNWELLRQCAEQTGLIFEPTDLGGAHGQYAVLWFSADAQKPSVGHSVGPVYKLLNIRDPWNDQRLSQWKGLKVSRSFDADGHLLPATVTGQREWALIPLAVYDLRYPKQPLLLIDFRDTEHIRRHEMTQRSINQITAGVVGLSRITNWYYFAGAMAFNFVTGRHGSAVKMADRLDSYSDFRAQLAVDRHLEPALSGEIKRRAASLFVSPLDVAPQQATEVAKTRYAMLLAQGEPGSSLLARLDRDRRAELAAFGKSKGSYAVRTLLHFGSLQLYTKRVSKQDLNLQALDRGRRLEYHLAFLDAAVRNGTPPEVTWSSSQIQTSVAELGVLMQHVDSSVLRSHAQATLNRVAELSQDSSIQAKCRETIIAFNSPKPDEKSASAAELSSPVSSTTASLTLASGLQ